MKVILVMVATINGKTTKGNIPGTTDLASIEDQEYFFQTLAENNLLIMGSKTYEAARLDMKLTADRLRVILTSNPDKYKKYFREGELEFSSLPLHNLLESLEKRGFNQAILLGGERTNTDFLREKLVDEIWLTLEPKIFGEGNELLSTTDVAIDLELLSIDRLNTRGTMLLKYAVRR